MNTYNKIITTHIAVKRLKYRVLTFYVKFWVYMDFLGSMTLIRFLRKCETLKGPKKHWVNQGTHWCDAQRLQPITVVGRKELHSSGNTYTWEGGMIEDEELAQVGSQVDVAREWSRWDGWRVRRSKMVQEERNVGVGERRRRFISGWLNSPAGANGRKEEEEVFWEHLSWIQFFPSCSWSAHVIKLTNNWKCRS